MPSDMPYALKELQPRKRIFRSGIKLFTFRIGHWRVFCTVDKQNRRIRCGNMVNRADILDIKAENPLRELIQYA